MKKILPTDALWTNRTDSQASTSVIPGFICPPPKRITLVFIAQGLITSCAVVRRVDGGQQLLGFRNVAFEDIVFQEQGVRFSLFLLYRTYGQPIASL